MGKQIVLTDKAKKELVSQMRMETAYGIMERLLLRRRFWIFRAPGKAKRDE